MNSTAGRNCAGDGCGFKILAGCEERHDRAGMAGFDRGIRRRTIGIGLCRADCRIIGLDRPEIGRDMQDARHGNGDHAGDPDQGPEVAQTCTDSVEHVVEHAALEAIVDLPSMTRDKSRRHSTGAVARVAVSRSSAIACHRIYQTNQFAGICRRSPANRRRHAAISRAGRNSGARRASALPNRATKCGSCSSRCSRRASASVSPTGK